MWRHYALGTVMYGGFQGGPQLSTHDAERPLLLFVSGKSQVIKGVRTIRPWTFAHGQFAHKCCFFEKNYLIEKT